MRDQEERILSNLLRETREGRVRWGFQPPSTVQANQGKIHYVLRARPGKQTRYKLTARRDGSRDVNFTIERAEAEADQLTELYRFAMRGRAQSDAGEQKP